jgi:phage FluMu protein gp41
MDRSELVRLLEDALFIVPTDQPDVAPLDLAPVRGRVTPLSHPLANLVGSLPGIETVSGAVIQDVVEFFRERGKVFGWITGPQSPRGLNRRLEANRLVKIEELTGMALCDLAKPIVTRPGVRVVEVGSEEREQFAALLSVAFELPADVAALMADVLYFNPSHLRVRNYLAFLGGVADPVGLGSTIYLPDSPVVLLMGGATLKRHRHRGVFRGLTARRLADAKEDAEAALIQAPRATAAPICEKMGFEEVCRQALYTWEPDVPA